ncbi:hypothetical protein H0H92_012002 [Tricholoma furcatifolium]|nr:hypothetical protein H0H92_012002 [Tricholoma furcatifolium]
MSTEDLHITSLRDRTYASPQNRIDSQKGHCLPIMSKEKIVCRQCTKMNRAHACEYDDKQQKSRTQLLKEQLSQLERRLQDLESGSSSDSSGAPSPSEHADLEFGPSRYEPTLLSGQHYNTPLFGSPSLTPPLSDCGTTGPSIQLHPKIRPKKRRLDVFMAHRHQCWFYSSMDRFFEPALPGIEPHPALINAMYLLACHFANIEFYSELEPAFFVQVQHEVNLALDTSDRLTDIVQASALLAIYLYMNNRVMEGYRHTFSAIKLAVGLGLHQIQQPNTLTGVFPTQPPLISLPLPRDQNELDDRILAFWQIFMVDRCWSVVNGLPLALPDRDTAQCRILTPWPSTFGSDKFDVIGFQQPVQAFFEGIDLSNPSSDNLPTLKAKAAALYELSSRCKNVSDLNDWRYHYAESAVERFSSSIPSVLFDRDYFAVQTLAHASLLHLQHHGAVDGRALKAGNSIVQLICQLGDADWQYLDPIVSPCWLSAAEMFMLAIASDKINTSSEDPVLQGYRRNLDVISQALNTFGGHSPLASDFALKIELARS